MSLKTTGKGAHGEGETFKHAEERRRATGGPLKPQLLFVVVKATQTLVFHI